jgi:NADPH-dependent glutamate synthase beta subunit-like oxidoreductase
VELQNVDSFYFDEAGKAVISLIDGAVETIPADTVIFALGQKPEGTAEMGLELAAGAYLKVNDAQETSVEGVFAAGDVVTGTKSVIEAIAAGRRSAEAMDAYLGGDGDISEKLADTLPADPFIGPQPGFAVLARRYPGLSEAGAIGLNFGEVEAALDAEASGCEAGRCLQCDLRLCLSRPKLWNEYESRAEK